MATKEFEQKKEIARSLYFAGEQQNDIADKIGVAAITVSRWVRGENWKERRAALRVTPRELINKTLARINDLLESENPDADKLSKLAATIAALDKKTNVVTAIDVFLDFSNWLTLRMPSNPDITAEIVKHITLLQQAYVNEKVALND